MTRRIEPGQEYETCQPVYWLEAPDGTRGPTHTRIRVVALPVVTGGRPLIATLTADGREVRRRQIDPRQLHDNPARRTGYRLVSGADGASAGGK